MASQMPTMAAIPPPDMPPFGKIDPGKTNVRVNAAGRMRSGIGMKQKGVRPAIISSMGMPMVPRAAMTLWMKPMGKRIPTLTKNQRRHRKVVPVRIIMKNIAIMKTAVMAPAICDCLSECAFGFPNMRIDQAAIGKVNRPARTILRGVLKPGCSTRGLVAIPLPPQKHDDPQRAVIEGDEHRCHPCDRNHGFVALHAAQTGKRHEPDRCPHKESGKEKKCPCDAA